jgi:hypothetical protein
LACGWHQIGCGEVVIRCGKAWNFPQTKGTKETCKSNGRAEMTPKHPRAKIEAHARSTLTGAADAECRRFRRWQVRSALANADPTDVYKATQAADVLQM